MINEIYPISEILKVLLEEKIILLRRERIFELKDMDLD